MKAKYFFTSLTSVLDLPDTVFSVEPVPQRRSETSD